ncbi:MAG: tRNA lysidine(34) synthetase TilS, partial [Bradymonadaceae bacterium]
MLEHRIDAFLSARAAQRPRPGLLLAMSGGLDSTVLLDLLRVICPRHGLELATVHVDHGLRPDSHLDAAFCERVAASLNIPHRTEKLSIVPGHSTQSRARNARYAALAGAARVFGMDCVVTAHHADDAVETALLNLSRGTGLPGLVSPGESGPYPFPHSDLHILRPLLSTPRAELEEYAHERDLPFRSDPTNIKDDYERNRLRHHVIPLLTEGRGSSPLATSLANLRMEAQALEAYADALHEASRVHEPGLQTVALDRQVLAGAPAGCVALLLRRLHDGWSQKSLEEALRLISSDLPSSRLAIKEAVVILRPDRVVIEPVEGRGIGALDQRVAAPARIPLHEKGTLPFFEGLLSWERRAVQSEDAHPLPDNRAARFDADSLGDVLELRGPRQGEKLNVPGMGGRKKISDVFQEATIPPDIRWRWPCLAHPDDFSGHRVGQ